MIARAIALPRGSPEAVNASGVSVEMLEVSTATAGPVIERSARTGTDSEWDGDPAKA